MNNRLRLKFWIWRGKPSACGRPDPLWFLCSFLKARQVLPLLWHFRLPWFPCERLAYFYRILFPGSRSLLTRHSPSASVLHFFQILKSTTVMTKVLLKSRAALYWPPNKEEEWMHQSFSIDSKIFNVGRCTHFASPCSQKWVIFKLFCFKLSKRGLT